MCQILPLAWNIHNRSPIKFLHGKWDTISQGRYSVYTIPSFSMQHSNVHFELPIEHSLIARVPLFWPWENENSWCFQHVQKSKVLNKTEVFKFYLLASSKLIIKFTILHLPTTNISCWKYDINYADYVSTVVIFIPLFEGMKETNQSSETYFVPFIPLSTEFNQLCHVLNAINIIYFKP